LELPPELSKVHHTFHVSNLKKCYADEPLAMPLEGVHIDDTLQFVEEPVEIMEREIKQLKRSWIPLVLSFEDKALLTGGDYNISQFRSDFYHEEFTDELAHIISPPEYDCFSFKNEPNSENFTMDVVEDNFLTREPRVHVHNVLPTNPTLQLNLDFILSSESLFAYVLWIFLPFLSYLVGPQYLLSFGNKDTIFDPGISSYHISTFMPDVSHRSGTFMKFNVYPKHLNEIPMEILFSTCSPMDQ
nr:putative reverse transcriptase domain-containing protein [Tanacetum cinerariifolium]